MNQVEYGSGAGRLPSFVKAALSGGVGSVRALGLAEHKEVSSKSVNRFPVKGGTLNWEAHADCVLHAFEFNDEEEGIVRLAEVMSIHFSSVDEVFLLWGSHDIPTVALPVGEVVMHVRHIFEVDVDFWFYVESVNLLVEVTIGGDITVASLEW